MTSDVTQKRTTSSPLGRGDRVGGLFQGAYRRKRVGGDQYLVHLSRYIHLDPVMDGLVEHPEDWEFSSYQEYVGLRGGTLPRPRIVLGQFGSADEYGEFVESYTAGDRAMIGDLLSREAPRPRQRDSRPQTVCDQTTDVVGRLEVGGDRALVHDMADLR